MRTYLGVSVQNELADFLHRELRPRPDLGRVERVEVDLVDLFRLHDLNHHGPAGVASFLDMLEEVALGEVRVFTAHLEGFIVIELLDALLGQEMVLHVNRISEVKTSNITLIYLYKDVFAVSVHPLERVASVSDHETPPDRSRVVGHQHHTGML